MFRTSSYTIYIDLPNASDEMLLVHGYTGAYDKVSRNVANYVRSLEVGAPPDPLYGSWVTEPATITVPTAVPVPSDAAVTLLKRRGYLTAMSRDEEEGYFARTVKKLHQRSLRAAPSYIFMPTYNCNLRCSYCFQDHMRTKPEFQHLLRTMTEEMVDRIFAAMPEIEENHGIEHGEDVERRVGFYGGEPFLAVNRGIIEYIVNKARSHGRTSFWAVSNATELDTYGDLLGPAGIASIQITLDGPPDEHDKRRIYADGSGSFDKIARNIDMCLDAGVNVSIRMNIDRNNIVHVPKLATEIVNRHWDMHPHFSVYTAPIRAANDKTEMATTFNTWELDQAIDELRVKFEPMSVIGRPDDGMETRARRVFDDRADPLPQFRESFCGAHTTMYIFDTFGDVYACWERTGSSSFRIGQVVDGGHLEMAGGLGKLWRSRTVASNPTCRKCRYSLHCGGGCAVLAEAHAGKFFTNYCDGFADRFRHSVATAYQSFLSGAAVNHQERVCDL